MPGAALSGGATTRQGKLAAPARMFPRWVCVLSSDRAGGFPAPAPEPAVRCGGSALSTASGLTQVPASRVTSAELGLRAFWRDWAAWGCLSHPPAIIPVRENQLHVESCWGIHKCHSSPKGKGLPGLHDSQEWEISTDRSVLGSCRDEGVSILQACILVSFTGFSSWRSQRWPGPSPPGTGRFWKSTGSAEVWERVTAGGQPCPVLGEHSPTRAPSPRGCSEELPPFPGAEEGSGKVLQSCSKGPLPVRPSQGPGRRRPDAEKKPFAR